MAVWTCFSCDTDVEYDDHVFEPQFISEASGRTTFVMNGVRIHECAEGSYHRPTPRLRPL